MLSRAALPLLRPGTLHSAARLALCRASTRGIKNDSRRLRRPEDYKLPESADLPDWKRTADKAQSKDPLRRVEASATERLDPKPIESTESSNEPESFSNEQQPTPFKSRSSLPQAAADHESDKPLPDLRNGIPSEFDAEAEQRTPLPDLTRGIPSTLDAELRQGQAGHESTRDSMNITEDPSEPLPPGAGGRGGDGLPRSAYVSSSDRRRAMVIQYVYLGLLLGGVGYVLYLGRNWEDEEEKRAHSEVPDGWSPGLIYGRLKARLGSTVSYYRDPVTTKLLPDEESDPNLRAPFTLVLSLEDMLVHSEWSRENGWRVAKRPGVDYFLKYLSQYYELVLFTSQPSFSVDQILRKLDPYQMIRFPLFREATLYKDGGYVKDLSYINRDLKKVVIIDTNEHHVRNQPENAIVIPKWKGDPKDQGLVNMIPFLEYLATMGFEDSREVLKSFQGKDIPVEFDRRQKILREKFEAKEAEKRKRKPKASLGGLGSFFGTKPQHADGMLSLDEASAEGKMIWDQIRERGQMNYLAMEKRIKDEGAKWLAEREAEEKKMQEEAMANMKTGFFGWFGGSKGPGEK